jgi:hypothetical protein
MQSLTDFGMSQVREARRRIPRALGLERLEARSLLDGGFSPTAVEQLYLEELNDDRFDPVAYGDSLDSRVISDYDYLAAGTDPIHFGLPPGPGSDLSNVAPAQPLAMNTLLVQAARLHSQDMIARNYFGNIDPDGLSAGQRMKAAGFPVKVSREPIVKSPIDLNGRSFPDDYAARAAAFSLALLIQDRGQPDLEHRAILLDIGGGLRSLRQVGIGLATQDGTDSIGRLTVAARTNATTIALASSSKKEKPFVTGVVFNDLNGDGKYGPGEGLGGVRITIGHGRSTTTLDSGGYQTRRGESACLEAWG